MDFIEVLVESSLFGYRQAQVIVDDIVDEYACLFDEGWSYTRQAIRLVELDKSLTVSEKTKLVKDLYRRALNYSSRHLDDIVFAASAVDEQDAKYRHDV